ncbi:Transposase OS=Bosea thiooxidans OX=53254 GN=SAMN05660750_03303 PE=4 SV=1 [Bosea thiooxidans]|uniref:Uncharacterized protein n=2 Tax=Bosea thiooxidans TaxID=53254 RepID=A0A1T5FKK1_9HYPH|nr:hypothetical protein SAMN05660750_03303 [Bosea thiooxidans]
MPWIRPGDVAGGARTIGQHLSRGFCLVEIWCLECMSMGEIMVHDLPPGMAIAKVWKRYRCSDCGGKNLWSGVSCAEIVARDQAGLLGRL